MSKRSIDWRRLVPVVAATCSLPSMVAGCATPRMAAAIHRSTTTSTVPADLGRPAAEEKVSGPFQPESEPAASPSATIRLVQFSPETPLTDEPTDVSPAASSADDAAEPAEEIAEEPAREIGEGIAASIPAVELSVDDCVQAALTAHPRILAAQARAAAAANRVPQQRALPDPMLDNMFWPIERNALQTAGGRMQNQMAFTQDVPWPEKREAQAAIAAQEAAIAQAETETIEREIAEAVRLAYYELWAARRTAEVIGENEKLVERLTDVAETRYRVGGSQQDVLDAEEERDRLRQRLLEVAAQEAAAQAELAALMRHPRSLSVTPATTLPVNDLPDRLETLIAAAEHCNPQLRGRAREIQRDVQRQRLACLQRYPDLRLGTQYGWMTRDEALSRQADGIDNLSFSVGVTLPIWREKIAAGINEAAWERVSSSHLLQDERLSIEGRLRRLLAEVDSLERQRSLYRERIIPRTEQMLEIVTSEYSVGRVAFPALIETYQDLLLFQLENVQLDAALASRLAQLERTVGCDIASVGGTM